MGADQDLDFDEVNADPEVEALNDALPEGERGFYARHMDGDVMWHAAPDRDRCDGHGWITCYCGGDLCICGNGGEIECDGCEDCEPSEDNNEWDDDHA